MAEGLRVSANVRVKLTKHNEAGKPIDITETKIELTGKEAESLWRSQQQE